MARRKFNAVSGVALLTWGASELSFWSTFIWIQLNVFYRNVLCPLRSVCGFLTMFGRALQAQRGSIQAVQRDVGRAVGLHFSLSGWLQPRWTR